MNIITLTLNPAFDIHCYCENFKPYSENVVSVTSRDACGKGVNTSRALTAAGIENTAYIVVGSENKDSFLNKLEADGVNYREITVPGRIRENITLHTESMPETRISFSGLKATDEIIHTIREMLLCEDLENSVITLSGSLPEGVSKDCLKAMLSELKAKGAKIIIDSRSFNRADLLEVKPFLIKPNEDEIKLYSHMDRVDIKSALGAAKELRDEGISNVLVSLGGKGAVLASEQGSFSAVPPQITAVSTIGAGDSMIGGFIAATGNGLPYKDALVWAVAYGSGACMTEGTAPPHKDKIAELINGIKINEEKN